MKALILDPHHSINALGGARALGRAGWEVGVSYSSEPTAAAKSRYVSSFHQVPAAEADTLGFVTALRSIVSDGRYDIVFPIEDADLLALSAERAEIPACIPFAPHDRILRSVDKLGLTAAAESVGLRGPRSVVATDDSLASWTGPVVIKSRFHWDPRSPSNMSRLDPRFFESADAPGVQHRLSYLRDHGAEAILQEHIEGRLMALSLVIDAAGEPVAVVQQTTVGRWPSPRGISLRACTVPIEDDLVDRCVRLLAREEWFGLAELQFMRDAHGEPFLIDLNGRFYGSMPLALAAGVNLPHIWGSLALGRPVARPAVRARPDVRYQWLQGDLVDAASLGGRRRILEMWRALRFAFGATSPVLSWRDPKPMIFWVAGGLMRRGSRWVR